MKKTTLSILVTALLAMLGIVGSTAITGTKAQDIDSTKIVEQSKAVQRTQSPSVEQQQRIRVGAICNDGSESTATGRGACSHHGGVKCWKYSDGTCTKP